jgi:hypothetical protein
METVIPLPTEGRKRDDTQNENIPNNLIIPPNSGSDIIQYLRIPPAYEIIYLFPGLLCHYFIQL